MKNDRAQAILPGYGHFIELKYFEQQIYYSDDSGDDQPAGYFIPQTGNAPSEASVRLHQSWLYGLNGLLYGAEESYCHQTYKSAPCFIIS